jgi:hypothetical protein
MATTSPTSGNTEGAASAAPSAGPAALDLLTESSVPHELAAWAADVQAAMRTMALLGHRVLPLVVETKKPPFKTRPRHAAATTDMTMINEWHERWPLANAGFVNGPDSDAFTVDIDVKNDVRGWDTVHAVERRAGRRLPRTWQQITPSGGEHRIYTWPTGVKRMRGTLGRGVEIQAVGKITVLAPSRHPNPVYRHPYGTYRPVSEKVSAPDWLVELVRLDDEPDREPVVVRDALPAGEITAKGEQRLRGIIRIVVMAQPGERHRRLVWASATLAGVYLEGDIAKDVAFKALYIAAERCGEVRDHGKDDVARAITDGWGLGVR